MVWQCAVANCSTTEMNNPTKLASFGVPKDIKIKIEWEKILKCDFQNVSLRVCENHFSPNDIQSGVTREHNGAVILQVIMFNFRNFSVRINPYTYFNLKCFLQKSNK